MILNFDSKSKKVDFACVMELCGNKINIMAEQVFLEKNDYDRNIKC